MNWDVLRVVIFVLYGVTVGQTAWVLRAYFQTMRKTRRLLARHVVLVSIALLGFELVSAYRSIVNIGSGFSWLVPINLFLFSVTVLAMYDIGMHVTRKAKTHNEIRSLIDDPKETD